MNRFSRTLAVAGVTGALAVGATGVAQASTGNGTRSGANHASRVLRHDRSVRDRSLRDSKRDNHR